MGFSETTTFSARGRTSTTLTKVILKMILCSRGCSNHIIQSPKRPYPPKRTRKPITKQVYNHPLQICIIDSGWVPAFSWGWNDRWLTEDSHTGSMQIEKKRNIRLQNPQAYTYSYVFVYMFNECKYVNTHNNRRHIYIYTNKNDIVLWYLFPKIDLFRIFTKFMKAQEISRSGKWSLQNGLVVVRKKYSPWLFFSYNTWWSILIYFEHYLLSICIPSAATAFVQHGIFFRNRHSVSSSGTHESKVARLPGIG